MEKVEAILKSSNFHTNNAVLNRLRREIDDIQVRPMMQKKFFTINEYIESYDESVDRILKILKIEFKDFLKKYYEEKFREFDIPVKHVEVDIDGKIIYDD